MDRKILRNLSRRVNKKDRIELAGRFQCSCGHINNVLSGYRKNDEILIAAAEIALRKEERLSQAFEPIGRYSNKQ